MFFLLLITVSILALLIFMRFRQPQPRKLIKFVAIICFSFSWVAVVMWFTSLAEAWQIALSTPAANSESIAAWNRTVLTLLREAVYLLPVSRLTLAILYASPFLLIPVTLTIIKRSQATVILMFSTLMNLLFFWIQLLVDYGITASFSKISIQGVIMLTTYAAMLYILVRQRPFNRHLNSYE